MGFSPRKAKLSLYLKTGDPENEKILEMLGKHTTGKSCVYVNKLEDIDLEVLKKLIIQTIDYMKKNYEANSIGMTLA